MEQEAAQELVDREGHQTLLVLVSGVSPTKGDLVLLEGDEAVIGDGDAMRVAAQVMEDMLGSTEGRLAVDDPIVVEQLPEKGGESLGWSKKLQATVEGELFPGKGALESGDELAPEDTTEHLNGKKEAMARVNPTSVVEAEPARRNDAVDMRMMFQLLVPGMEHAEEADVGTEMLRIPSDFAQRFSAGAEQQTVDDLLILQGQRGARR